MITIMFILLEQDIEDYLVDNGGKNILFEYRNTGTLSESSRHKLVNHLVDILIQRHGLYPKSFEKIMISKAALDLFPKFKVDGTQNGTVILFEYFVYIPHRNGL